MKERLTLVTSFSSLKAGDYIELRRCRADDCGATHRGLLVRYCPRVDGDIDGKPDYSPGWLFTPPAPCYSTSDVGPHAVKERRVYLIDTGLESTTETRKRKKANA